MCFKWSLAHRQIRGIHSQNSHSACAQPMACATLLTSTTFLPKGCSRASPSARSPQASIRAAKSPYINMCRAIALLSPANQDSGAAFIRAAAATTALRAAKMNTSPGPCSFSIPLSTRDRPSRTCSAVGARARMPRGSASPAHRPLRQSRHCPARAPRSADASGSPCGHAPAP